jgi:GntR family galactonate operon transcriptional repressor
MAYLGKTLDLLQAPNNVNRRRLHGSVAHEIAILIIGGKLAPGEVLPNEDTLSAALNVSRTAYREGIRTLVAKGLLRARPKVGTTVNPRASWNILDGDVLSWYFEVAPDPAFITALFELRGIVEPSAAQFASVRHDAEDAAMMKAALDGMKKPQESPSLVLEADLAFHHAILVSSKNEALLALSSVIESTLRWSARLKMSSSPRIYESTLPEHEQVLDAILARDGAMAASQLRGLVDKALRQTLEALKHQRSAG